MQLCKGLLHFMRRQRNAPDDTVRLSVASTLSCTAAVQLYAALLVTYTAPCGKPGVRPCAITCNDMLVIAVGRMTDHSNLRKAAHCVMTSTRVVTVCANLKLQEDLMLGLSGSSFELATCQPAPACLSPTNPTP